jgi:hypothetical protein
MCLLETFKLLNKKKSNNNKNFDYFSFIDLLIKDTIFLYSSKFCVFLNHLLYCILSIITLSKVFSIFFIEKYSIFNFITLYFDGNNNDNDALAKMQNSNLYRVYNIEKEDIISNKKMMIFLIIFFSFMFAFLLYRLIKTLLNVFLFSIIIFISFIIFFNSFNLTHTLNLDKRINWLGHDYTYVNNII